MSPTANILDPYGPAKCLCFCGTLLPCSMVNFYAFHRWEWIDWDIWPIIQYFLISIHFKLYLPRYTVSISGLKQQFREASVEKKNTDAVGYILHSLRVR